MWIDKLPIMLVPERRKQGANYNLGGHGVSINSSYAPFNGDDAFGALIIDTSTDQSKTRSNIHLEVMKLEDAYIRSPHKWPKC